MKTWRPGTQVAFILQSRRPSQPSMVPSNYGQPTGPGFWSGYGDYWFRTYEAAACEAAALTTRHLELRVLRVTTTVEELPDATTEPPKENA